MAKSTSDDIYATLADAIRKQSSSASSRVVGKHPALGAPYKS